MPTMYTGWVVFVLRLPTRPASRGTLRLINPFSGTTIVVGLLEEEIAAEDRTANAIKTSDLARVDCSVSPDGLRKVQLH